MTKTPQQNDWEINQQRQNAASLLAEDILKVSGFTSAPIDPLALAKREGKSLKFMGSDFGTQFDGQLEYHPEKKRFLLFFNDKYDADCEPGTHHPRTRFSIAHELGHYFLEHHRQLLLQGRRPHKSTGEFRSAVQLEREADAFAAALLMPSSLLRPAINQSPLSVAGIKAVAKDFNTSWVSTAIRSVQHTHFPCGLFGIRDGDLAWMFISTPLILAKLYPRGRNAALSTTAQEQWKKFKEGDVESVKRDVRAKELFKIYPDELENIWATEEYLPAPILDTLLVLVTIDEAELIPDSEREYRDDYDDDD